jgi:hypothetical protein
MEFMWDGRLSMGTFWIKKSLYDLYQLLATNPEFMIFSSYFQLFTTSLLFYNLASLVC